MKRIMSMVLIMMSILSVSCFADETDPGEILKKVRDTYKSMETYRSEGTTIINTEKEDQKTEMVTTYSIVLKKPNLYRISYEMKFSLGHNVVGGTIWSDGTQPYKYDSGTKSYSELPTDLNAISGAGAMSSSTIVFTFFSSILEEPWDFFEGFINVKLEGSEKIEDEECYVISADSKISSKEIFWISKTRSLIVKHSSSAEGPADELAMEMSDESIIKHLKSIGEEVSEEKIQQFKEKIQVGKENVKVVLTETQDQISSPELTVADFQFTLPE